MIDATTTAEPTKAPTPSPTKNPTASPTGSPSEMPSGAPSDSPTTSPSAFPSAAPTEPPTLSFAPSGAPTEARVIASSIVIDKSNTRSSTPLLIVGACCAVALASTGMYLYRRGLSDKISRNPAMIAMGSDKDLQGDGSLYSIEKGLGQTQTFDVKFSESESRISEGVSEDGNARLRILPKSIYIPKIFRQRSKEGDEPKNGAVTWNQIREEDLARSSCSSGLAPASAPSPMLSPFFGKGMIPSILSPKNGFGKRTMLVDEPADDELVDVDEAAERGSAAVFQRAGKKARKSPMKEIVVPREAPSGQWDEAYPGNFDLRPSPSGGGQSAKSSESSIEWGIDVSKERPSQASFEDNVAELQDLLVSIKSLGSQERASGAEECDVQMTYTQDSEEANVTSVVSETSPSVGGIDICPVESASTADDASVRGVSFGLPSSQRTAPGITFGRELMNSGRSDEDGTFTFSNIVSDPNNDLYECRAPSGPLGVVVDTTPLGPRVRSLNPLSPIFGKISPGDVVVGVDEVDTVGMEAGEFWKIVSRKANQQVRVLTVLRI
ncbi:hypothetical protein ACHAXT_004316 [Thalassiosira profunda]